MYRIEIIEDFSRLKALQEDWKALLEKTEHHVFQTHEYITVWWEIFGKVYRMAILKIIDSETSNTVAIFPFYTEYRMVIKIASMIADRHADYLHVISSLPPNTLADIWVDHVCKKIKWAMIRFNSIIENSYTDMFITRLRERGCQVIIKPIDKAPKLILNGAWEQYYGSIDKRIRSDTQRQFKRLRKMGELRLVQIEGSKIDDDMDQFFSMHNRRWAGIDKKPLFSDSINRDFYRRMAHTFDREGILAFSKFMCGKRIVAMHFGFSYHGEFSYYIPAFNKEFYAYSPGRILILELIKKCFKDGYTLFDFMAGDENYKNDFANTSKQLKQIMILPSTTKGRLLKFIKYRLLPSLRRTIQERPKRNTSFFL